jgi:hypothetical protein
MKTTPTLVLLWIICAGCATLAEGVCAGTSVSANNRLATVPTPRFSLTRTLHGRRILFHRGNGNHVSISKE